MANYGLGSPFPEDAKLCAALSSFWPAVAPDITRSYWPSLSPTIVPMLDKEIGANGNSKSWDGDPGPQIDRSGNNVSVRFKRLDYVDYTKAALNDEFDYHMLSKIDVVEYQTRLQKLAKVRSTGTSGFDNAMLASYTQADDTDGDVETVMARENVEFVGTIHKFLFMNAVAANPVSGQFAFIDVRIDKERTVLIDDLDNLHVV